MSAPATIRRGGTDAQLVGVLDHYSARQVIGRKLDELEWSDADNIVSELSQRPATLDAARAIDRLARHAARVCAAFGASAPLGARHIALHADDG